MRHPLMNVYDFIIAWQPILSWFLNFLNSNFSAALAGAAGGARVARKILRRDKYRDELIREINNTNAASGIAGSVCNAFLSFKDQQVKGWKERYEEDRNRHMSFQETLQRSNESSAPVFEIELDMKTFWPAAVPIQALQD